MKPVTKPKGNIFVGRKYFQMILSDKRLISKLYKKSHNFVSKSKQYDLKMSRGSERAFYQKNINSQLMCEKMLSLTNHQGNTIKNHNEVSPHTCQSGHPLKDNK